MPIRRGVAHFDMTAFKWVSDPHATMAGDGYGHVGFHLRCFDLRGRNEPIRLSLRRPRREPCHQARWHCNRLPGVFVLKKCTDLARLTPIKAIVPQAW